MPNSDDTSPVGEATPKGSRHGLELLAFALLSIVLSLAVGQAADGKNKPPPKKPHHAQPAKKKTKKPKKATAPSKPHNGTIVFVTDKNDQNEIWSITASGSSRKQLTHAPSNANQDDAAPAISPDGTTVAFTRTGGDLDTAEAIWLMKIDGTGQRRLAADADSPGFYPDGKHLVATSENADGYSEIVAIDTTTGSQSTLCPASNSDFDHPVVSPDGRYLVYADSNLGLVLATLKPALNCQASVIDPNGDTPTFSAAGALAWVDAGGDSSSVMVAPRVGLPGQPVSTGDTEDFQPAFSPDGTQIAFSALSANGDFEIYRMPAAGGAIFDVTNDILPPAPNCDPEDPACPDWPPSLPNDTQPVWQTVRR